MTQKLLANSIITEHSGTCHFCEDCSQRSTTRHFVLPRCVLLAAFCLDLRIIRFAVLGQHSAHCLHIGFDSRSCSSWLFLSFCIAHKKISRKLQPTKSKSSVCVCLLLHVTFWRWFVVWVLELYRHCSYSSMFWPTTPVKASSDCRLQFQRVFERRSGLISDLFLRQQLLVGFGSRRLDDHSLGCVSQLRLSSAIALVDGSDRSDHRSFVQQPTFDICEGAEIDCFGRSSDGIRSLVSSLLFDSPQTDSFSCNFGTFGHQRNSCQSSMRSPIRNVFYVYIIDT
ncbi:hypothetical protein M3Y94_00563600 [Aphelenchoides besseyi]|nr:hypothetical protein M3Y94_00563600 [Aphelenchoides besseyi]